jgi:hypothetical protein
MAEHLWVGSLTRKDVEEYRLGELLDEICPVGLLTAGQEGVRKLHQQTQQVDVVNLPDHNTIVDAEALVVLLGFSLVKEKSITFTPDRFNTPLRSWQTAE